MSKNWIITGFQYDFNPNLKNYILSRYTHFKFCTKNDPAITASIYLDNLIVEIKKELAKAKVTNKKTLVLSTMQEYLMDSSLKSELITLFEEPKIIESDVQSLIDKTLKALGTRQKQDKNISSSLDTRTYLIALHLYLELEGKEDEYEALTRKTKNLKDSITSLFNAPNLSSRISGMKGFSYKKILNSKARESEKGQLKPQFKQIINNPHIFGKEVSDYAQKILNEKFT